MAQSSHEDEYRPGQASAASTQRKRRRSEGASDYARRVSKPKRMFRLRLLILMCAFSLICGVYAVRLIALQVAGNAYSVFSPADSAVGVETKTVVLRAARGDIYDRDGTPLVTSASSYTVLLDYDGLYSIGGHAQRNRALLQLQSAVDTAVRNEEVAGLMLCAEAFPFEGAYPSLRYAQDAQNLETALGKSHRAVLSFLGLREDTSASSLVQYYVKMYELDGRVDGIPLYSDAEIDRLIRIYYNMDRLHFAPGAAYTYLSCESENLITALRNLSVPGVLFEATVSRLYHYPGYASHLLGEVESLSLQQEQQYYNALGYATNALIGKSGCESAFNALLCGKDGELELTYNAAGRVIDRKVTVEPVPGRDLILTIDIDVQIAAEDALRVNVATIANNGSTRQGIDCDAGAVVALDSATGAVLALGSYPTVDLSVILQDVTSAQDDSLARLNRALMSTYTPSTLYTLCTATAGLDLGSITASERLPDIGHFETDTGVLQCPLYREFGESHGSLNVITALQDGCEVFFAQLGGNLGIKLLNYYGEDMGFGQSTGIELPESVGALAGPAYREAAGLAAWVPSMTPSAAAGLSDNEATPLQLASMLSVLLAGGNRYEIHVFSESRSYVSGDVLEQYRPTLLAEMDLHDGVSELLLSALEDKASANTLLWSKTAELRASGIRVGYLGAESFSGTMSSENALCVAYGRNKSGESISVCVVLEHGASADMASPTVAAVLEAWAAASH